MPPSTEQQKHLEALSTLLEAQGLGAADLLQAITALAAVKQQEGQQHNREEGNKVFQDKLLLYPGSEDAFIFRYGTDVTPFAAPVLMRASGAGLIQSLSKGWAVSCA